MKVGPAGDYLGISQEREVPFGHLVAQPGGDHEYCLPNIGEKPNTPQLITQRLLRFLRLGSSGNHIVGLELGQKRDADST